MSSILTPSFELNSSSRDTTTEGSTHDALAAHARRRVIARTVYGAVMASWIVVSAALVAIWYLTTPTGYFWPVWPVLNFVIVALIWGLAVYQRFPFRVSEDRIRAEVERLRAQTSR